MHHKISCCNPSALPAGGSSLGAKLAQQVFHLLVFVCPIPARLVKYRAGAALVLADIVCSSAGHPPVPGADGEAVNLVYIKIPAVHAGGVSDGGMVAQKGFQVAISNANEVFGAVYNGFPGGPGFHFNFLLAAFAFMPNYSFAACLVSSYWG